jgi:hypothetical protein
MGSCVNAVMPAEVIQPSVTRVEPGSRRWLPTVKTAETVATPLTPMSCSRSRLTFSDKRSERADVVDRLPVMRPISY